MKIIKHRITHELLSYSTSEECQKKESLKQSCALCTKEHTAVQGLADCKNQTTSMHKSGF